MIHKGTTITKVLATQITLIGLGTGVCDQVTNEMTTLAEGFRTYFTRMVLLSRMYEHVLYKVITPTKALITHIT